MLGRVTHVTIYQNDLDAAKAFYQNTLGFEVTDDQKDEASGFRWLTVRPSADSAEVVLHGSKGNEQRVGGFTGVVFHSDDVDAMYERLKAQGVEFTTEPADVGYGRHAMFKDPSGNELYVVQPNGE